VPGSEVRLPDFLVVGAQKAGTTWLHDNLGRHPGIFLPGKKELEFFSHDDVFRRGARWYGSFFAGAEASQLAGEATPSYLWVADDHGEWARFPPGFSRQIPERVLAVLGARVKLIASLRNPVSRAVSAFVHHVRRGRVDARQGVFSFAHQGGLIHMGFYAAHLRRWFDVFDAENFHICIFEELVQAPERGLAGVTGFLGLPELVDLGRASRRSNEGIRQAWGEDGVTVEVDGERITVATVEDLARLVEIYRDDVTSLGEIMDRDLRSIWSDFA
jgi:hypothetical protein